MNMKSIFLLLLIVLSFNVLSNEDVIIKELASNTLISEIKEIKNKNVLILVLCNKYLNKCVPINFDINELEKKGELKTDSKLPDNFQINNSSYKVDKKNQKILLSFSYSIFERIYKIETEGTTIEYPIKRNDVLEYELNLESNSKQIQQNNTNKIYTVLYYSSF